ncbi:hypothetical protein BDP27DRAFT_1361300 [Rhodocollybia butyracea]|uniref:Uncharacterized protein n=1 Tax=Rhodocollybia butyracea TaxID=206335 RepID=A0A9P5PY62_9AGAR|nr:hypothetical protein BDP27DRAFT_1361300 [Rhodocollybia butyracea]
MPWRCRRAGIAARHETTGTAAEVQVGKNYPIWRFLKNPTLNWHLQDPPFPSVRVGESSLMGQRRWRVSTAPCEKSCACPERLLQMHGTKKYQFMPRKLLQSDKPFKQRKMKFETAFGNNIQLDEGLSVYLGEVKPLYVKLARWMSPSKNRIIFGQEWRIVR